MPNLSEEFNKQRINNNEVKLKLNSEKRANSTLLNLYIYLINKLQNALYTQTNLPLVVLAKRLFILENIIKDLQQLNKYLTRMHVIPYNTKHFDKIRRNCTQLYIRIVVNKKKIKDQIKESRKYCMINHNNNDSCILCQL